jgi:guanine deaminase
MMCELACLANKYDLPIQSHISENLNELKFAAEIFPDANNYAEIYDKCNLLNSKCILAHGVHLTSDELTLLQKRKVSLSHCASSNINLQSGLCDVLRLIENGITVGLGTDVSGGSKISILDAIRSSLDVSQCLNIIKKGKIEGTGQVTGNELNSSYKPLDYKQGIYLATLGGAKGK